MEQPAAYLIAPFRKLVTTGRPWVHAKWAMTLDGKIATHSGDSRWISNEASRAIVHRLRGRMDAIIVGAGTARKDDPLLTARPPGPRTATRIVVDSQARLSLTSQLVRTVSEAPLLVAASTDAPAENVRQLQEHGADVLQLPASKEAGVDLDRLLAELGRRQFTNVLFEGGSRLFGSLFDAGVVDEVHVFIAPKIVGGANAPSAVAGKGLAQMGSVFASTRWRSNKSGTMSTSADAAARLTGDRFFHRGEKLGNMALRQDFSASMQVRDDIPCGGRFT